MARWLYGSNEAKKNEKLQLSMAQLGADVKRSLLVAVPEALPTGRVRMGDMLGDTNGVEDGRHPSSDGSNRKGLSDEEVQCFDI